MKLSGDNLRVIYVESCCTTKFQAHSLSKNIALNPTQPAKMVHTLQRDSIQHY